MKADKRYDIFPLDTPRSAVEEGAAFRSAASSVFPRAAREAIAMPDTSWQNSPLHTGAEMEKQWRLHTKWDMFAGERQEIFAIVFICI